MEIPTPDKVSPPQLQYDPEWLAITRAFHPFLSLERRQVLPSREEAEKLLMEARNWVEDNIVNAPPLKVPAEEVATEKSIESGEAVTEEGREDTAAAITAKPEDDGGMAADTGTGMPEGGQELSREQAPSPSSGRPMTLLDVEATQYFYRTAPTQEEGGGGPGEAQPAA
jgi:lariat debranching enzyme